MNTMLRSPTAPQQTALAHSSMPPAGLSATSGVHRGVWIGGGLMALTIVALATALVMKSGGSETSTQLAATSPAVTALQPATSPVTTPAPAAVTPAPAPVAATPAPVIEPAPAPAPVHHVVRHSAPVRTASVEDGPLSTGAGTSAGPGGTVGGGMASPLPANNPPTTQVASVPVCTTCGVVDSYDAVQVAGQSNGVGAVAGGVGGAVVGSQIAGRHNRTLGGVIGAIGGGLLGNVIEQHERTTTMYDVHVRMTDGSMRTVRQATIPQVGARVSVDGNTLHAAPQQTSGGYGGTTPTGSGGATFTPTGS